MVIFTGVIAFVTTVQATTSYLQWNVMQKALDANERAWVIPSAPSGIQLEPNQSLTVGAILKNYGKGPAFDVTLSWHTGFSLSSIPPVQRKPGESKAPLMSGEAAPVTLHVKPMSTSDVADVKAGTKTFFLIGDVVYSDPFATSDRTTRVCFKYVPPAAGWTHCELQIYR